MISEKYLIREAIEAGLCLNDYERRLAEGWNSGERITYKVWANKEEKAAFMEKSKMGGGRFSEMIRELREKMAGTTS